MSLSPLAIGPIIACFVSVCNLTQRGLRTLHTVCSVHAMNYPQSSHLDLSNPDTFADVFSEHERGVYSAALRVTNNPTSAQDVVQDVFLRLWRKPTRFDPARGEIGPFLRLMARSRALDLWREGDASNRATDRYKSAVEYAPQRLDAQPEVDCESRDEQTRVRALVRELPDAQREAVALAYWAGLTSEEIATHAGVPVGTAKSRVRLGITRLRDVCGPELAAA